MNHPIKNDLRLIEAGFLCHQVGAETQRERDTGKSPPPTRLHVWWARRPLTGKILEKIEVDDEAHEPMTKIELKLLAACVQNPKSTPDLLQILGYKSRTGNFKKALSRLLSQSLLEITIPDKPNSRLQKYRLTDARKHLLKSMQE